MEPALPISAEAVERTLLPLERATQLPPRAFTEPGVLAWEMEHVFRRGWVGACHIDQLAGRGRFVCWRSASRATSAASPWPAPGSGAAAR